MNALSQTVNSEGQVLVREFQNGDESAFARLNQAWIEKFFRLEDKDRATLENPRKYILESGGQVFLAVCGVKIVGCVAIVVIDSFTHEIVKMAVERHIRDGE